MFGRFVYVCMYLCMYVCIYVHMDQIVCMCVYNEQVFISWRRLRAKEFGLLYRVRSPWPWPGPWAPVAGHLLWRIGATTMLGGSYALHDALTCPWCAAVGTVIGWWGCDSRPANNIARQRSYLLGIRGRPWPHQGRLLYAMVCIVLCMCVCMYVSNHHGF